MSAQGISREDVADLNPGDTVNVRRVDWPSATTGELWLNDKGDLMHGGCTVRLSNGDPSAFLFRIDVVHRAPIPLYVNHPRTEPTDGDVVRDADGSGRQTWQFDSFDLDCPWNQAGLSVTHDRNELPRRLRLLVDGETGQVVQ